MSETSSEVSLHEVLEWAQVQAKHLRSPSARFVLWYLTANAFRYEDNPENAVTGQVMSGRTGLAAIRRATGYTEKTVRTALQELQDEGFIIAEMSPGRGRSRILVFWSEAADQMREDHRQGIKPLPKAFQRKTNVTPAEPQNAVILQFPKAVNTTSSKR